MGGCLGTGEQSRLPTLPLLTPRDRGTVSQTGRDDSLCPALGLLRHDPSGCLGHTHAVPHHKRTSQANVPPCHWSVRWHCVLPGRSLPSDRWTFSVRTGSSLILPAGVDVHRVRGLPHEDLAPRTRRYGLRIREERGRERTRLAPPSRSSNSGSNAGAAGHVFVPIVLHTLRLAFVAVVRDAQGPREGPRKPGFTDDVLDDAAWQVTTRPA